MIENEIRKIASSFEGLYYVDSEDSGEGILFSIGVSFLDTITFDKADYLNWETLLESIDIFRPNFQIYCSYDKSGYDYWSNIMEESNYTFINIWISSDFSDEDFNSLWREIGKIYNKLDDFNTYHK